MKWFILLLIVIGDPMAVIMVIVFNKVVKSDDDGLEGLPMGALIGDKPKEPLTTGDGHNQSLVDPVSGHIDLPEEALPMEEDIWLGNNGESVDIETLPEEPKSDYIKQIQDKIRRDIPIEDDALNDAVNDAVNEHVEIVEEPSLPNPSEMIVMEKKEKVRMDEPVVENSPEEQIVENIEEVKQLKREPIIPRGKIIEEDVIKSKTKNRDFSVDVPDPKVTNIGSQKEIREDKPNTFFFKRRRRDELGND